MTEHVRNIPVSIESEIWRPIPSAPGYAASNRGQISGRQIAIMKPKMTEAGYLRLSLYINGVEKGFNVSWLVCEAFHGPQPTPQHQAAHWDGNKLHNCENNLRWATPVENQADRRRHGTMIEGEDSPNAKLTEAAAAEVKAAYVNNRVGTRIRPGVREALAAKFGVTAGTIQRVGNGYGLRHVR